MRTRSVRLAGLMVSVLLLAELSFAIRTHQDCGNPSVFRGAEVNLVVLPYVSVGGTRSRMAEIGQRLALLVKLDAFAHVLEYGGLGATQMEVPQGADPSTCLPQVVIPKLLGQSPGADITTAKGNGLIIVWGVLYEEGEDIVIQSYARLLRRDTSESFAFPLAGFTFYGQPSSQVVAFTPRSFKKSLLEEIEFSYQRADFVRKEPRDDAEGEPLPRPVAKCISCLGDLTPGFQVEEYRGEWIHVRWFDPVSKRERDGWIHAAGSFAGKSLDTVLPELHFLQGSVGYLKQRIAVAKGETLSLQLANTATKEFQEFVEANDSVAGKSTNAVALQLAGIIRMSQGDTAGAQKLFKTAFSLAPFDPDAATLASVSQIEEEWKGHKSISSPEAVLDNLTGIAAIAKDPGSALQNLKSFLQLLQSLPPSSLPPGISRNTLQRRLEAVNGVKVPSS